VPEGRWPNAVTGGKAPVQDRQGSPRKRLRATTAGRDAHVVPLGTALLRERVPVGSARTRQLRLLEECQKAADQEQFELSYQARLGVPASVGWQGEAFVATRTRTLRCPPVGCSGTSAPRAAADQRETKADPRWNQAQGSIGRQFDGNVEVPLRTWRWTKALRSSDRPRQTSRAPSVRGRYLEGVHESRATARGHGPRWPGPDDHDVSNSEGRTRFAWKDPT